MDDIMVWFLRIPACAFRLGREGLPGGSRQREPLLCSERHPFSQVRLPLRHGERGLCFESVLSYPVRHSFLAKPSGIWTFSLPRFRTESIHTAAEGPFSHRHSAEARRAGILRSVLSAIPEPSECKPAWIWS